MKCPTCGRPLSRRAVRSLSLSVEGLNGLTTRTLNHLKAQGVTRVAELVRLTPIDVLMMPAFGKKSLREIEEVLAANGLSLHKQLRITKEQERPEP